MKRLQLLALAFVAASAVACSEDSKKGDGNPAPDGGGGGGDGGKPSTTVEEYPDGPYGADLGDVLQNFAFQGLVNETADGPTKDAEWSDHYSMALVAKTGMKYAFVHVSSVDSDLSKGAAQQLADEGGDLVKKGAQIVEVLAGANGAFGTKAELEEWVSTYPMAVTAVVDDPESPLTVLDALGAPEAGFIVEMPDMKITWVSRGVAGYSTVEDGITWLGHLLTE